MSQTNESRATDPAIKIGGMSRWRQPDIEAVIANAEAKRIAVAPTQIDQIDQIARISAPAKNTDRREVEGKTEQAEAVPTDMLNENEKRAAIDRQGAAIQPAREEHDRQS